MSILNPVVLSIKYRSVACLKFLVENYGLRPSMTKVDIIIRRLQGGGEYPFNQWVLPICLKIKDLDTLSFLLRQPGLHFSSQDLNSFITYAIEDQWITGLKTFMQSSAAHFVFAATLEHSEQSNLLSRILRACYEIEDAKIKKHFWTQIVEEVLTRRPYAKHLAMHLLDDPMPKNGLDLLFIARECMKQVTSEDLWMIYLQDSVLTQLNHMRFFEDQYPSSLVGKELQPNLQGELAKIVMRYSNEAKPSGER